jgi:succinoglycan biosynthesis transport protein ExoP
LNDKSNHPFVGPVANEAEPGSEAQLEEGEFMRKWTLIVFERKWYALAVFLITVIAAAVYTYTEIPLYQGTTTVQVLKRGAQALRVSDVVENSVTNEFDFNTQIKLLESGVIAQNVVSRLTPDELHLLTEPYRKRSGQPPSAVGIVIQGRKIIPQRLSLVTAIQFLHPNPAMAARVADLIASEYIAFNTHVRVEESMKVVDDLKDRADQQRKRVDEIANALQAYRERGNLISLMQSKDIVTQKLKSLSEFTTTTGERLREAEVRWRQVDEMQKSGGDLTELPFISNQANVGQLVGEIASKRLELAQLRQRYKDKHPRVIEAQKGLDQATTELNSALAVAAASVNNEYQNALRTDAEAHKALTEQETTSLQSDRSAVEYENLDRDFKVNEQLLEAMMERIREASISNSIETDSARIVDRAVEAGSPVSPKVGLNMLVGVLLGVLFGLGSAYLIAAFDDRIKTPFDVETVVGLPLLGVIPRAAQMDAQDRAQIVSNGADRIIIEAFLSLYSALRISDESKNARHILVTSSLPGEGKSFIASNLALTFASQGQRTLIVDCDLRKPVLQRTYRLSTTKGLVNYCTETASLEEIILKNVLPNLDVIAVGGRAKNPIQLLNCKAFENLVAELGRRYDRIVYDSPPMGAVSDALNILPLMDGAIYAIRFNGVKRVVAQRCVRRLKSANISIFGAVLNDVQRSLSNEYYVEYDSKAVKEYFYPKFSGVAEPKAQ